MLEVLSLGSFGGTKLTKDEDGNFVIPFRMTESSKYLIRYTMFSMNVHYLMY